MSLRTSSRARLGAIALGMSLASASFAGCGRESLFIDFTGGGGAGASPITGGGGTGGTGGSECIPTTETCNGFDDNCNGQVDEGCSCTNGQSQTCYSGPAETLGVGPCHAGNQLCKDGAWGPCSGETIPIMELCDQADNNCNGQVDDGNPGGGSECNVGLSGLCGIGMKKCVAGGLVCAQVTFPTAEQCDGLDNNCNGQIDDGNPGGGGSCDTGQPGVCAIGSQTCANGMLSCVPVGSPVPEECDGQDNNCNGQTDEGNPGGGAACSTGLPGACGNGTTQCSGGALVCKASNPSNEVCNGIDDNCDGTIDNVPQAGMNCFIGGPPPCNQGKWQCMGNNLVCVQAGNGNPETCDGADNNCNGQVDEGNPGGGAACSTGVPGACDPGTITCKSGMLKCVANVAQSAEKCDIAGDEDCNGVSATVLFSETFANNTAGWTLDQEWQIGAATTSMGQNYGNPDPANDHTPTADNGIAGVVIGGNAQSQPQHPYRYLTSPVITIDPATPTVWLQFWRWLNSDFSPWMTNRVEVFNNQTMSWVQVWQSGSSPGLQDNAWTKQVFDITNLSKGGSIRVRFGFNIAQQGAFVVSQWNVDDVIITTDPCE